MAINKVVYGQQTLIDLTSDTVTSAAHIVAGHVGHLADGTQVTGTAPKKHTATVTARTNSSGGYVRYIGSTGAQYRDIGDTFEFNPGEALYTVGMDSRGSDGKIIIDGVTVASGGQSSVNYTYTLPDHDISISFSAGTTSIEEASSVLLQSKSVSYTPSETAQSATVTADNGYDGLSSVAVSVGAVSGTFVGSQVPRQAAQTIHPSASNQTIASDTYLTGTQTIEAVTTNLTADKIVNGFTAKIGSATDDDCVTSIVGTAAGGTPAISVVDTTDTAGGTVRTITALDISDTTAVASDVAQGKYFYTAQGVKTAGTASGGTPSQTQHSIYFEFSDSTDTTITGYWNDSFISDAIIATTPTTYGQKTVTLAQLDGTTWYQPQETWETLYEDTKAPNADTPYNYFWLDSLSAVYPTVGSTWKVTIDGTSYTCTAYALYISGVGSNVVCFGNPKYSGGTDDGSSIPANFYNAGWGAMVADTELPAVSHTIKIERLVTA